MIAIAARSQSAMSASMCKVNCRPVATAGTIPTAPPSPRSSSQTMLMRHPSPAALTAKAEPRPTLAKAAVACGNSSPAASPQCDHAPTVAHSTRSRSASRHSNDRDTEAIVAIAVAIVAATVSTPTLTSLQSIAGPYRARVKQVAR